MVLNVSYSRLSLPVFSLGQDVKPIECRYFSKSPGKRTLPFSPP